MGVAETMLYACMSALGSWSILSYLLINVCMHYVEFIFLVVIYD